MRALIIGGSRFFGRHLAQALLNSGDQVTLLNRGRTDDGLGPHVERLKGDRTNMASLKEALGDRVFDVVIDQICFDADEAKEACEIFADRTPLYIATSTISVYDRAADIPEESFDPYNFHFNKVAKGMIHYGEAKRQMESVFYQKAPFRVITPRFPIVCGMDDYTGRLLFHVRKIKNSEPIFVPNLDARMSYIDSHEAGLCLEFLARQKEFSGPINCSSPDAISIATLLSWIEEATGKKGIYTHDSSQGEPSPYGTESDYFPSTKKLEALGFQCSPLKKWLPPLLRNLAQL